MTSADRDIYQVNFHAGDTLIGMAVRSGSQVDQLTFLALHHDGEFEVFGPFGGSGGGSGITFGDIQAFYGRSGGGIDQIGVKGRLFG